MIYKQNGKYKTYDVDEEGLKKVLKLIDDRSQLEEKESYDAQSAEKGLSGTGPIID